MPEPIAPVSQGLLDIQWPDVAKSLGIGAAKGFADIAGVPGDLKSLFEKYLSTATRTAPPALSGTVNAPGPDWYNRAVRALLAARSAAELPTGGSLRQHIDSLTGYQPQTAAGGFAQSVGENAPAAMLGAAGIMKLPDFGALTEAGAKTAAATLSPVRQFLAEHFPSDLWQRSLINAAMSPGRAAVPANLQIQQTD